LILIKWYPSEGSLLAVFDKALTACPLPLEVSGSKVIQDLRWEKVGGLPAAWVWTCQHEALKEAESILVDSKTLSLSTPEYRCSVDTETPESLTERKENLQWQLESTEQIIEMEPDSKWPLLTSVILLNAMKPASCHTRKYEALDKLKVVDPYRKHYYSDLKSKFLLEDNLKPNMAEVNLSSLGLTSLHGCHLMAVTELLDLSNNELKSEMLTHLRHCSRLKRLILTGNPIENDEFIKFLPPNVEVVK